MGLGPDGLRRPAVGYPVDAVVGFARPLEVVERGDCLAATFGGRGPRIDQDTVAEQDFVGRILPGGDVEVSDHEHRQSGFQGFDPGPDQRGAVRARGLGDGVVGGVADGELAPGIAV